MIKDEYGFHKFAKICKNMKGRLRKEIDMTNVELYDSDIYPSAGEVTMECGM